MIVAAYMDNFHGIFFTFLTRCSNYEFSLLFTGISKFYDYNYVLNHTFFIIFGIGFPNFCWSNTCPFTWLGDFIYHSFSLYYCSLLSLDKEMISSSTMSKALFFLSNKADTRLLLFLFHSQYETSLQIIRLRAQANSHGRK